MKILINFWDYCFYRAYCFYRHLLKNWVNQAFAFRASTAVGVTHMFHIISLSFLWSAISGYRCNAAYSIIVSVLLMFYYDAHVYTEEKYKLLSKKYKRGKNKRIKGWGVFLYIILSVMMPFVLAFLLRDKIHIYIPNWLRFFDMSSFRIAALGVSTSLWVAAGWELALLI